MFNDCIIMAGGSGTRLWPASTSSRPKQFLSQPQEGSGPEAARSFFMAAIERALAATGSSDDSHIVIVAGKNHIDPIAADCSRLDAHDRKRLVLIPEPFARNTAAAIACALQYIDWVACGRERNILVLTSDHVIKPLETFKTDANAAAAMAQADKLVVFGIQPHRPETGYGYIEAAGSLTMPPLEEAGRQARYEPEVFSVASFREKPDADTARQFIAAKNFYWNSGMFAFSSKFMLAEFRRRAPEVALPFSKLWAPNEHCYDAKDGLRILQNWVNLEKAYTDAKAISFDYAIAEKCESTVMIKAGFSWTDVGSWDEYSRLAVCTEAEVYATEGAKASCFVDSDIPVALCGVEDLIVVIRSGKDGGPAAALISKKGQTQRVKDIVEEIKGAGKGGLL